MEKFRLLYVADEPSEYEMVIALLESSNLFQSIHRVENKSEFSGLIHSFDFDIILTDFNLRQFHGFEVLQILNSEKKSIPVIFVTTTLSDEIAAEIIKKGASDYLLLQNIHSLIPSIHSAIERKKMRDEKNYALARLRESEENYRILAESSPYGIIVHSNYRLKYYNKQAIMIFQAELKGDYHNSTITDFIHKDFQNVVLDRASKLYAGISFPEFFEIVLLNSSGTKIQVEVASASIIFNGEPSAQVIFRDISERKRIQKELLEAKEKAEESDRLKTAFLENMSHEIRTPLNGIIGFSTLLKYKKLDEAERFKYLEVIEQSGKHLLNIINDLIEISRIESGHIEIRKEMVNLNNILDDLQVFFSNSARLKDIPVDIILHKPVLNDDSFVYADFIRLKQVLINLLNNALKFTSRGSITFGYELIRDALIRFYVRDTGIGIPEDSKHYIFERFRQVDDTKTREFGGAGLGLTISKGLVEIMGGEIWFESRYKEGTCFYFTLPLSLHKPGEGQDLSRELKEFDADWSGRTVLIAEDENSNFLLLKIILRNTGIKIDHVTDGQMVLNKIRKDPESYDLILMDLKMPVMGGMEAIAKLRNEKFNIPVIAQTAYAMSDDRQKCINAGFNEYITKPIKSAELLNKIKTVLVNSDKKRMQMR